MPVEIRELIISATVSGQPATHSSSSAGTDPETEKLKRALQALQKNLKQKRER
ncbi:MAG: hypothetical protein JNL57_12840 [Bacteroidetes bacterium]|nr:hypothetical protein [Bacteroidota bacterium]